MSVVNGLRHRAQHLRHGRGLLGVAFAFCAGWALSRWTILPERSTATTRAATALTPDQPTNERLVRLDTAGSPGSSLARRSNRQRAEAEIFFLAAAALVALGWWLLPDTTSPHVVPGFSISVDDTAVAPDLVDYSEVHPRNNAVDAYVTVGFTKGGMPVGSELLISIDLPNNVTYQSCESGDNINRVQCSGGGGYAVQADISILHRTTGTGVIFHFSGSGLGFVESGGQVAAELPFLYGVTSGKFNTITYHINDASSYQWSGDQPELSRSSALWGDDPGMMANQPIVTGVRGDAQSRNSDLTFAAGVVVGTAGAALIAALQALFRWLTRE